jgi:hypothetical protein
MFRSAPMPRAVVLVPRARLDAVIEALKSLAVLHLVDVPLREEWGWGAWFVGSVTRRLIESTSVPVVVVPAVPGRDEEVP